jgi:4-amino-4-deoxy-L-arabinose transferase-like glycosyltransferase
MNRRERNILLAIIIVSVTLRVGAALYLGNEVEILPGTHDQISYHTLSLRVLDGHGLTFGELWWPATKAGSPTAHWSYLYLGFLSAIYKIFGANPLAARLLQGILVGVLQPYLAFLIGWRVFNQTIGLASAAITAIYGYFIYYAASLMTEAFYIIAIMFSLYLAILLTDRALAAEIRSGFGQVIKWGAILGITLGVIVLLRQLFLLLIPFLFAWILWRGGRKTIGPLLISGLVVIVLIIPFTIYNYSRFERFVLLNTNAGFAFYWGNHPIYGIHFESILPDEMGSYQELIPEELSGLNEAALDQELLKRGLRFVISDPVRYVRLSLSRIPPYLKFWPSSDSSMVSNIVRVGSFGIMLPFILYGLVLSFVHRSKPLFKQPLGLLYLYILIYAAVHVLTWTLIRYRLPIDAILVVFAGYGLIDLINRIPKARDWLELSAQRM